MKKNKNATSGDFIAQSETKPVAKKETKKNKGKKGPGFFKRMGSKIKDVFSELKKVSWPSFAKVVKQTGVVLAVVLVFLIVIMLFDWGLMELLKLVSPKA